MLTRLHQPISHLLLSFGGTINKAAHCWGQRGALPHAWKAGSATGFAPEVQTQRKPVDRTAELI